MEEKIIVKMLQLATKNKEMKWKLMKFPKLKKECIKLRQKEETWIKVDRALIKYKHKVERLEREKQLWL